jgi:hypothetical protein
LAASANCFERVTVRRVDVTLASMRRTISNRSDTTLLPSLPTTSAKGAKKGQNAKDAHPFARARPIDEQGVARRSRIEALKPLTKAEDRR